MAEPHAQSFAVNRARWDELVAIHMRSRFYAVEAFRAGKDVLLPIEAAEIGDVAGRRLAHLQCHFGLDSLSLARRGAIVTGLDFAPAAIAAARGLAAETGLAARFVEGNVYDAAGLLQGRFDIVYVTWGAICWLPDIRRWAAVASALLAPGGFLYLLEAHPAAVALGQASAEAPIVPTYDYVSGEAPVVSTSEVSYSGDSDPVANATTHEWNHGLAAILNGMIEAGLAIEWLHEHEALPWPLFPCMQEGPDRMFRLPAGQPRFPLAFSVRARKPAD